MSSSRRANDTPEDSQQQQQQQRESRRTQDHDEHQHESQGRPECSHEGAGAVPAVSIAVYQDFYGPHIGSESSGGPQLVAGRHKIGPRSERRCSSSTTSDVDSGDDAASIASRLSQIVDEQEFYLLNDDTCDRHSHKLQSHSMGNLLLALDGKQQRQCQRHNKLAAPHSDQEARSASELAVNFLTANPDGSPMGGSSATSLQNDDANNNRALSEQRAHSDVERRSLSRDNSSSSLSTKIGGGGGGGLFQPERGNLKHLESSRQQAMAAALKLKQAEASPESDGGELMLNIRRSAWKLDEFEQAFKPPEAPTFEARQRHYSFNWPREDGVTGSSASIASAGAPHHGDLPVKTRNLLLRSFRRARRSSVKTGDTGAPSGGSDPASRQASQNKLSPLRQLNPSLADLETGPGGRRYSHLDQPSAQLQQQQQTQIGGASKTAGHLLSAHLSEPARRDSRASMGSFASSLDSARSTRPFGRLGELLSPSHRERARKQHEGAACNMDRAGGVDTPSPQEAPADDCCCRGACPTLAGLKQCLPALEWLPAYEWRANLLGDLTAGLAVAVLNISTSLSAAVVAETDLGVAFRSSIINTLVYALLCSSRHTSFGSWSIMSQMLLDSVRRALSDELILSRINLGPQAAWSAAEYGTWHMNIIIMYTFLIGLVQLAAGLLNLGNILASFIPEALSSSMIAATAFTMAIGQLANMCGTSNKILWAVEKNSTDEQLMELADLENSFMTPLSITDLFAGLFRWIQQLALLAKHHDRINLAALTISLTTVCLLALNQYYLQAKLRALFKKDNLFLPFEMILLVIWILVSYQLDLPGDQYRVTTCGPISLDFGAPNLPNLRLVRELWFDSLATALISYTMVYIMARTYSNKLKYEINNNQELVACGAGNLIGGLFDALPATASFSRTAGQVESGGRTQMASLVNCVALTLMVRLFGHHAAQLPVCVMSATLFFGFARMMSRCQEVLVYWRICKVDFAIWLVTFAAILTLDLVTGFVYGFIFSILTMLYRAQNRRCYLLGSVGSTADVYVPLAKYPLARELDNIKIFQFCGPIHYVCADLFERLLRQKTRVNVKDILKRQAQLPEAQVHQPQQQQEAVAAACFDPRTMNLPTHVILDFSMISFIDSAGIHVIVKIINDFQQVNITVMLASLASHVARVVKSEPSLWQAHKDRFYVTLADAVQHALRDNHPKLVPLDSIISA